jgi:putative endonuclease
VRHYLYILVSSRDGKHYIGCTGNLEDRLRRHNRGLVRATRHRTPLRLIYSEAFETSEQAFAREKHFKSWAGRIELAKILAARKGGSAPNAGKPNYRQAG